MAANGEPSTARKKRYSRAAAPDGLLPLTPVKVQMLRFLAEMRFLSLPQLAQLCCPSEREDLSQKSARKHLRTLFDAGMVDVLPVSRLALAPLDAPNDATLLYGSAPNIYVPTADGLQMLYKAGLICREWSKRPPAAYGPKNSLFLAHELQVRDVRVWIESCAVASRGEQKVLAWKDGQDAAIDLTQDSSPRWVRPDAWFIYQVKEATDHDSKPVVLVAFVEVDRGTERGCLRWQEKLDAYETLFASGRLKDITGYQNARVLTICSDGKRSDALCEFIRRNTLSGMTQKVWLADHAVLDRPNHLLPLWRRPPAESYQSLL